MTRPTESVVRIIAEPTTPNEAFVLAAHAGTIIRVSGGKTAVKKVCDLRSHSRFAVSHEARSDYSAFVA